MSTLGIMHGKRGGGIKLYDEEGNEIKLAGKGLKISFTAANDKAYYDAEVELKNEVLPNFTDTSIYKYGIMIEHKGKCHYIGAGINGRNHYIMDLNKNTSNLSFTQINNSPINTLSYVTGISYDNKLHIFFSNLHYTWDEVQDTWTEIETLPFYITGLCKTVIYDDEINILGNIAGSKWGHRRLNKETSAWNSITVPSNLQYEIWVGLQPAVATEYGIYYMGGNICRYTKSGGWVRLDDQSISKYPSDTSIYLWRRWAVSIGNTIFAGFDDVESISKTTNSTFNWTTIEYSQDGTTTHRAVNYAFAYNKAIYTFSMTFDQNEAFIRTTRQLSIYHPKVYMQVKY